MSVFDIGKYTYSVNVNYYDVSPILVETADIVDSIRSYDTMLHQSLDEIYRKRCSSSSSQSKKFRPDPQYNDDWKSIIKPILEQESIVSKHFSKEEFEKLSLLWIAVLGCYQQSTELLVRFGADVNELFGRHHPQVIDEKSTVLHVLLQMRPSPENERLIRLITDRNADLEVRDYKGCTVLHLAIKRRGLVQVTELFLKKGADVNTTDEEGMTPLLKAASSIESHKLLPLLIKYGADVLAKSRDGQNALHRLTRSLANTVDVARVLIEKGVPIDEEENLYHYQPIHLAAVKQCNELVKLYLDHGANVNALTNEGKSPIYYAASKGDVTVMKTLLKRGANIHLKTNKGRTVLHAACEYSLSRSLSIGPFGGNFNKKACSIRLLLSTGADMFVEDSAGRTPLYLMSYSLEFPEILALIEVLALKKALQPSIELADELIIERYQKLRDYYRKCTDEIDRMKSTRFIDCCNIFELVAKSQCQIAALMRNPDFETKFRHYDLNAEFSIYAENVVQAFERAQNYYRAMLEQEALIDEAVYHTLPHLVVRKVVHYALNCSENLK